MWRIIPVEKRNGYLSQAIVESILMNQNKGNREPTVFFYKWNPSAVAIGIFQKIHEACNVEECEKLGVDIVRRMTGGGSVYLDSENCFTYSVIAPSSILPKNISRCYRIICSKVVEALNELGIPASYKPTNDVLIGNRKVSGTVMTWKGNSVMVGGTMLMDLDLEIMERVLKFNTDKLKSRGIEYPYVTCIKEYSDISEREIIEKITEKFTDNDYYIGRLTEEEIEMAKKLENEKYRKKEWIFRR